MPCYLWPIIVDAMIWYNIFCLFPPLFHDDDDNKNLLIFVAYVCIPQDIFIRRE